MKKKHQLLFTQGRRNVFLQFFLGFFFGISSIPRLLLEVFFRTNFGYRYLKLISAFTIGIPMLIAPLVFGAIYMRTGEGLLYAITHYGSWLAFIGAFFYQCFQRQKEIIHPLTQDHLTRITEYGGDKNPILENVKLFGKRVTAKQVMTLVEPGIGLIAGIILLVFQQPIGYVIAIVSIIYSLSYYGAFYLCEEELMDMFDNIIRQEEMANVIVKGRGPQQAKGFEMFCEFPEDMDLRQRIFDAVKGEPEPMDAY